MRSIFSILNDLLASIVLLTVLPSAKSADVEYWNESTAPSDSGMSEDEPVKTIFPGVAEAGLTSLTVILSAVGSALVEKLTAAACL